MDRSRNSLFVPILIAVAVLGPVAIQILLPALPAVQTAFGATTGTVQLVLSVSMLALAVATLIYGPVSDRLGRRPVLLAALGLFLAGSAICAAAPRLWVLLAGRVVQAVGGAAGMVLSRAMARDRYGPENSAGIIAYLFIAIVIAPMPAPAIGGLLTDVIGWRANFVFTGAIGLALLVAVLLGLDETLGERPSRSGLASMLVAYGTLLRSRAFLGYALQSAFTVGAFFAFISTTPYIVVSVLGRPATEYGLYSLLVSAAMVIGNFGSTRLAAEARPADPVGQCAGAVGERDRSGPFAPGPLDPGHGVCPRRPARPGLRPLFAQLGRRRNRGGPRSGRVRVWPQQFPAIGRKRRVRTGSGHMAERHARADERLRNDCYYHRPALVHRPDQTEGGIGILISFLPKALPPSFGQQSNKRIHAA